MLWCPDVNVSAQNRAATLPANVLNGSERSAARFLFADAHLKNALGETCSYEHKRKLDLSFRRFFFRSLSIVSLSSLLSFVGRSGITTWRGVPNLARIDAIGALTTDAKPYTGIWPGSIILWEKYWSLDVQVNLRKEFSATVPQWRETLWIVTHTGRLAEDLVALERNR